MKLFEISWEVCNKVGGIYTVITSKYPEAKKNFPEYFFIGPHLSFYDPDFEKKEIPAKFKDICEELKNEGIEVFYGLWTKNQAEVFLIDSKKIFDKKNEIKTSLWDNFKVDSIYSKYEFDEPIVWAFGVGKFLEKVAKKFKNEEIVAQFHEWLTGAGLLYLKSVNAEIASVFTTHATVLERAIASENGKLWKNIDADLEAKKRNVSDKHTLEKQSALNADIFTVVSDIVAESCELLFGRKPEVVTVNGMDVKNLPNFEEIPEVHKKNKEKIKDFVMSYFYPYKYFDINKTLFYFTSGRYEIHSKGTDVLIKSAGQLNRKLIEDKIDKEIVLFIFIPSGNSGESIKVLENFNFLKKIKTSIGNYSMSISDKILDRYVSGKKESLLTQDFDKEIEKLIKLFKKTGKPPLSAYDLTNYNDKIVEMLLEQGLDNSAENKVKIIFYPAYLEENDGLLGMDYYSVLSGFHLGIFPSFYEPWGYTPIESATLGVPAITTDLAGFGKYILKNRNENEKNEGVIVLERENKSDSEVIDTLTNKMLTYAMMEKRERIKNKLLAENIAAKFSWENLFDNYINAYRQAIEKRRFR